MSLNSKTHMLVVIGLWFAFLCRDNSCLVDCVQQQHIHDIPSYIKLEKCHRFNPNVSQCLLNATEVVRPYLAKGIPEVLLPSIDPLIIPEIVLQQGTSALNFKAVLKNISVTGLTNYKFSQFDFDVPNLQWFIKGMISNVNLKGNYTVTGRILIAPIGGKGQFEAGIDNCNITAYQKANTTEWKGQTYLNTVATNTSIKVSGPKVKLEGLFGENEELNHVTNKIINDNIEVLFEEIKPVVEKLIMNIMEDVLLRSVEHNIPFDVLYPPTT